MSLRERKKRETRTAIADAALALFLARGFEPVTVADVARAADVSVNTVFNYFPTKEDLFFDRQAEVVDRLARALTEGEPIVAAVRRAFLDALKRDDPTLGLHPGVADFHAVIEASPALQARLRWIGEQTEAALAGRIAELTRARPGDPQPALAAAAIAGVDRALHAEIRRRMLAGDPPEAVRSAARTAARKGYGLLERGLGNL